MNKVIEFIQQPWPWWVSGPLIAYVMFSLLYFGKGFGLSTNFKTVCNILGADKLSDFFKFDWRDQIWNLMFIAGAIVGGFIAAHYLTPSQVVDISPKTIADLQAIGIAHPGATYEPPEIFSPENVWSLRSMIFLLLGGFFVGFGTRYANGCTSGHAISGLSNLQKWSLVAVVGFFIGGLAMTHLILPYLMKI
ncbi:MAG: YeeE/YedE family protein [Cyclobacteriaceae bacterium]|nr:YeeE/YedE family protein [Cyclobacteriaceae bacterium]